MKFFLSPTATHGNRRLRLMASLAYSVVVCSTIPHLSRWGVGPAPRTIVVVDSLLLNSSPPVFFFFNYWGSELELITTASAALIGSLNILGASLQMYTMGNGEKAVCVRVVVLLVCVALICGGRV